MTFTLESSIDFGAHVLAWTGVGCFAAVVFGMARDLARDARTMVRSHSSGKRSPVPK